MKEYMKPAISFQFMNLADDVSAGCAIEATSGEKICPVQLPQTAPGMTIFVKGSCTIYSANAQTQICYHVPTADNNVLGS